MFDDVAVAVVERQDRELAIGTIVRQPTGDRVEGDDLEPLLVQHVEDIFQEAGRDLQEPVGDERRVPPGPDVMERQDDTTASGQRREPPVRRQPDDGAEPRGVQAMVPAWRNGF